jgi:hypothetical protein
LKTTVLILAAAAALAACSDSATEIKYAAMPAELADCKVFYITNARGDSMTVVRCQNSSTSTEVRQGKTTQRTITVDGVEYVQK